MTRKSVLKKIAVPAMATVLMVGSCIVVSAGTSRGTTSSGVLCLL